MQKQGIQRGRPTGAKTFEAGPARAFSDAVRSLRTEDGIAQETLAHLAGIERCSGARYPDRRAQSSEKLSN